MPHLVDVMPISFAVFSAATLVFVFALLIYSLFVSDSEFANRKTSIIIFRSMVSSAFAALAFGLASILIILLK
ncbi:MAG: hypothetical protein L0Y50_01220 [Beijerinckiaceae bacterium]|nr:hypothetical protein [Beijerinckiaceae bacterium]MCI0734893.1 hypothetical protein [Beijerinckiaceae bacterium]